MTMWMVRAEVDNRLYQPFLEKGIVAIGWAKIGDLNQYRSREQLRSAVKLSWPNWKQQAQINAAGMLHRFATQIKIGDGVVTYNKQQRVYAVGTISGEYHHDPSFDSHNPNIRKVQWSNQEISRDEFSTATRNTLGSTLTLFLLSNEAEKEIRTVSEILSHPATDVQSKINVEPDDLVPEEEDLLHDIEAKSIEFIKDRIVKLNWSDLQELVAGLLRAMGYKTRVSPAGVDRGKDIVASPDGFGFEDPRIFVEVKHRPRTAIGSQDIRSFLGGRHASDKGLYVSTGGFSKDANYEAERANIPVTLMDLDALVEVLLENYEKMDTEAQRLIALKRVYWPLT